MDSSAISLIQISAHFHTHHSRDRLQLLSSCYTTYSSSYICPNSPLSSSALELLCPPFSSGHSHSAPTFTFLFCCPDSRSMRYFTSNFVRFVVMSILSFCPNNLCVELITVPNSSLCSTHHCFQLVILCYLSSFATCHCIQLVFVFNLSLCCTSQRIKFVIVFYLLSGLENHFYNQLRHQVQANCNCTKNSPCKRVPTLNHRFEHKSAFLKTGDLRQQLPVPKNQDLGQDKPRRGVVLISKLNILFLAYLTCYSEFLHTALSPTCSRIIIKL